MSEVWSIYYNHWAKEVNEKKKKIYTRACIKKIMYLLCKKSRFGASFLWNKDVCFILPFVLLEMRICLRFLRCLRMKLDLLHELSEIWNPSQTPREKDFLVIGFHTMEVRNDRIERGIQTPKCFPTPSEARLIKNMGKRYTNILCRYNLNSLEAHNIDANLCLF